MNDDVPESDDDQGDLLPSNQPSVDAASVQGVESQKRRLAREAKEGKDFWDGVFATAAGRREMWNLLKDAHAFETQFATGPNGFPQPEATWFKAGEQAWGLRLYQTWLMRDPVATAQMHAEHDRRFTPAPKKLDS